MTGGRLQHARISALDGMRGLAVAAVLLFHAEAGWATGGFLGVSAFFTLSGFLITTLLLTERRATDGIALGAFWARRARRLLPAAGIALAGIVAFGATVADPDQVRDLRGDVFGALAYVANWRFLFDGRAYSELFSSPSPVQHFWSLAIEEQFYVLFPLVVVAVLKLGRGRVLPLAATLGAAAIGSVVLGRVLADDPMRVYYGTDTRVVELLVGSLLAIVCMRWSGAPTGRAGRALLGGAGVLALAVLVWWWATVDQSDRWLYQGGFAVHALLAAVVIAAARVESPLARGLSFRPLVALGLISYGVYLYHWPVFLWLSPERLDIPWAALLAVRLAVTIAIAVASYHLVEQPIRHGARIRGAWPRVLTPAVAAGLVAALALVTASPPPPPFVLEAVSDNAPIALAPRDAPRVAPPVEAPAPEAPVVQYHRPLESTRPLRALVVGDSVGVTFGRGLELWAAESGAAVVRNEAVPWCSLGRDLPRAQPFGAQDPGAGCENWDEEWAQIIDEFDPDVVFVMYTVWEVSPRKLPGEDDYSVPGDRELDAWQLSEYQAATDVLAARGAPVNWFTIPCSEAPIVSGEPLWHVNRRLLPKLAATRDAARVIDLDAELCPGGRMPAEYAGVVDFRPDRAHFSDDGALAVARWVMQTVQGTTPPRAEPTAAAGALHRPVEAARPLRVMVVGDSVGLTLGRGFELWGRDTERITVRNEGRKYCSLGRYAPRIAGIGETEQGPACDDWEENWVPAVDDFDPDVVFVLYTKWEAIPRQVPSTTDYSEPGNVRYDAWQLSEYEAAADVLAARGARVVWLTIPCLKDADSSEGNLIWKVNRTIKHLSYAHSSVSVLDLDAELCPEHTFASTYRGVDPARPDGAHFSDSGAFAVADWLMGLVLQDVV